MAPSRQEWDAPLAHLRSLPFIRSLRFDPTEETIELTTPRGMHRLFVEVKRSYLDRGLVNAILSRAPEKSSGKSPTKLGEASARLVLARYIPAAVGEQFIDAGISFADDPGNAHLRLGDDYNWTVLGKREPPRPVEADRTTPATVQLLFQFATAPQSAKWTVRDLARAAGTSKTKVALLLNHFRRERLLGKSEFHVTPEIVDRLVSGYGQILRPKLVIGRYRYREPSIDQFLIRLSEEARTQKLQYALTGGPAAEAIQHFFHSSEAPVFLAPPDAAILRALGLLPDRTGPVVLLKPFGELIYWKELDGRMVAPPWLVYAELLASSDPRAREAAEELRRGFLQ
jgi:hypothetical protein